MSDEEQTEYLGNETWVGLVKGQIRLEVTDEQVVTDTIVIYPDQVRKLVAFFKRVGVLDE